MNKIKIYELWGKPNRENQLSWFNDVYNDRIIKYINKLKKNMGYEN